eukprot:TRINITY_DN3145_c0_g1_i1.p1 TRINITY_DN3145_c0_g1~~TRINITY_DN3145_c0_g1_i1.p1  ORF type:complete len:1615 (-),score=264.69 TRINITY_DN3145_c0_g1_i1:94-4938(-)
MVSCRFRALAAAACVALPLAAAQGLPTGDSTAVPKSADASDASQVPTLPPPNFSALMAATPRPRCATEGKAWRDPKLTSPNGAYVADADACQLSCMFHPVCKVFTYFADSKACWLQAKNAEVTEYDSPAAIKGPKSCDEEEIVKGMKLSFDEVDLDKSGTFDKNEALVAAKNLLKGELHAEPSQAQIEGVAKEMDIGTGADGTITLDDYESFMWRRLGKQNMASADHIASVEVAKAEKPECAEVGLAWNDPLVKSPNGGFLPRAKDCQRSCILTDGCSRFTYFANTKACWLQSAKSTLFPATAAISGPKSCSQEEAAAVHAASSREFVAAAGSLMRVPEFALNVTALVQSVAKPSCATIGNAYHDPSLSYPNGAYLADATHCQMSCQASPSCKVFTYYADSKACFLQSDADTESKYPAAISGPKACPGSIEPPNMKALLNSVAKPSCSILGQAYHDPRRNSPGGYLADASHCQELCKTRQDCIVFTYYADSKACWLHSGSFSQFASAAAISGPSDCDADLDATASQSIAAAEKEKPAALSLMNVTDLMKGVAKPPCARKGTAYHDHLGQDHPSRLAIDANECQVACSEDYTCKQFSYYVDTRACWLQGDHRTNEFEYPTAISGPRSCSVMMPEVSPASASVDRGVIPGVVVSERSATFPTLSPSDLADLVAKTKKPACSSAGKAYRDSSVTYPNGAYLAHATDCQTSCLLHHSCKVFTFYANTKACWLQGENATEFASDAAISGPKACAAPLAASENAQLPREPPVTKTMSAVTPAGLGLSGPAMRVPEFALNISALLDSVAKPSCASPGKAYHDPRVTYPNGAYLAEATHCQMSCQAHPSCKVFTYYAESKACWLQGENATEFRYPAAISGPKSCGVQGLALAQRSIPTPPVPTPPPVNVSWLMANTNKPDCSDVGKAYHHPSVTYPNGAYVHDALTCQWSCSANPSCKVFTYYVNSKACWLLGENATEFASEAAISGPKRCEIASRSAPLEVNAPLVMVPEVTMNAPLMRVPEFTLNMTALLESVAKPSCARSGKAYTDPSVTYPNGAYLAEATHCQMSCQAHPSCQVFTYYADSKACWLQGSNATEFEYPAAIAGPKSCFQTTETALGLSATAAVVPTLPPPNFTALMEATSRPRCAAEGKAYRDPNIKLPNGGYLPDADACQLACMGSPFCEVFTYFVNSQACWLQQKTSGLAEYASPAAINGPKSCDEQQLNKGIQMSFDAIGAKNGNLTKSEAMLAAKNLLSGELHHEPTQAQIESLVKEMDLSTGGDGVITSDDYKTYMWRRVGKERQVTMARLSALQLSKGIRPNCSDVGLAYHDPLVTSLNGGYLASSLDCQEACMLERDCGRFTYYANSHACWLLSAKSSLFPSTAAISGPKTCSEEDISDVRSQISRSPFQPIMRIPEFALNVSALIASVAKPSCANSGKAYRDPLVTYPNGAYLADATHCQMSCRINPSCRVFTYFANSKACWLQGDNTTTVESEFAISGPQSCEEHDASNLADVVLRQFAVTDADEQLEHTSPARGLFTSAGIWLSFAGLIAFGAYASSRGYRARYFHRVSDSLDEETGSQDSNALLAEQGIYLRAPLDVAETSLQGVTRSQCSRQDPTWG